MQIILDRCLRFGPQSHHPIQGSFTGHFERRHWVGLEEWQQVSFCCHLCARVKIAAAVDISFAVKPNNHVQNVLLFYVKQK